MDPAAIIFLGVVLLVDAVDFLEVFRQSPGPNWETRWGALDPAERVWLAEMSRSRAWLRTLTDPEEIALATGFYRRERRWRLYVDLAALPFMAAVGVLVLVGLLPLVALGLAAGAFATTRSLVLYLRDRRIQKAYREAKAVYQAVAA